MEIINLFLLSVSYYYLYEVEFYVKMLFLFVMSMLVSMFINHKYFEQKSNQPDGNTFIYFLIHSFIQLIFFCINGFFVILNYLLGLPVISHFYAFLNEINRHFLTGRNRIMITFGQFMFSTFAPQIGSLGPVPQQQTINNQRTAINNQSSSIDNQRPAFNSQSSAFDNVETKTNKNTFVDDNDMNSFLDGLLKKDK